MVNINKLKYNYCNIKFLTNTDGNLHFFTGGKKGDEAKKAEETVASEPVQESEPEPKPSTSEEVSTPYVLHESFQVVCTFCSRTKIVSRV